MIAKKLHLKALSVHSHYFFWSNATLLLILAFSINIPTVLTIAPFFQFSAFPVPYISGTIFVALHLQNDIAIANQYFNSIKVLDFKTSAVPY